MKKTIFVLMLALSVAACNSGNTNTTQTGTDSTAVSDSVPAVKDTTVVADTIATAK